MTRDEIYKKVQGVLVDALGVDEDEVTPTATLRGDLGAESIDFLDIVFRLEKAFGIKIPRGEMFPEDVLGNQQFVQNGRITLEGMAELKKRMPHMDFTQLEKDPDINKMQFTVDTIVNYIETKVNAAA
jgi:acyl carrier protein